MAIDAGSLPARPVSEDSADLAFEPDPSRAAMLDRAMLRALGDSLDHIREQASGRLGFDEAAFASLASRLRAGERHSPSTFARYYDLVERIGAADTRGAEALMAEIAASRPVPAGLRILPIGDPALAGVAALYRRRMNSDPTIAFSFLDPPPDLVPPFTARFGAAMALLDRAMPALSGEVRGLLSEIVLATHAQGDAYRFDGGSSYMLWGALFLNARFHETVVAMAEVIAHESAHTLLFGLSVEEPLVFNADDALYASPLRADPRPMDGIFHATFVSARMHWVMTRLAASGLLDAQEAAAAREAAAADRVNFLSGYETVAAHAQLSRNGAGLMRNAAAYMHGTG